MRSMRHICHRQSKRGPDRKGTLTVEFAIVAPLIFLLFLGSLELTALNFARQTAGNASYEAARKLIIPGGTVAQAEAEGLRQMKIAGMGTGAAVTIVDSTTSVTATVSVPASSVSWGLVRFCSGYTLRQTCTLTKE